MADVKVRFEVNPDAETEKLGDIYVDNVDKVANTSFIINSEGKYQDQPENSINGVEALSFAKGYIKINSSGNLVNEDTNLGVLTSEQEPQEFVWGATDSKGYYDVKISFRNATNLDAVVFYGDSVSNQFPTIAYIDNSEYPIYSDDVKWSIRFDEPSGEHSVRFTGWNRPNYNAVLTKIAVIPRYVEFDRLNGLKTLESLSQTTDRPNEIFYGSIASSGSIDVVDIDGDIEDMVRDGVIPASNMGVEIVINENPIQSHISFDSGYNPQSKLLTLSLTGELDRWDVIKNTKSKYGYYGISNLFGVLMGTLYNLGYRDERLEMVDEKIVYGYGDNLHYGTIREYLERLRFKNGYVYTDASTVYDLINEICTIAQLNLIQLDNGKLKFVSARPIEHEDKTIIKIPKKYQSSVPDREIFLKNKYNNVKYVKNTLIESVEPILDVTYSLRDEDGNLSLDNIDGENVHIITNDSGNSAICFFKTVTSTSELIRVDSNIWGRFKQHPFVRSFVYGEGAPVSGGESRSVGISTSDLLKEDFVFDTNGTIPSECIQLTKYSTNTSETFAIIINIDGDISQYAKEMSIKIYGSLYNVSQNEMSLNDNPNVYEFSYTKGLLTDKLNYQYANNVITMYDMIANNIINDYSKGINTATISVVCADYYDTNGNLFIDWSKGKVLQIGDIVQVDKDNNGTSVFTYASGEPMNFKITGRKLRKGGVPMLDLELQEVKLMGF